MRLFISALCATVTIGLLCSCAADSSGRIASFPSVGFGARTPGGLYDDEGPVRAVAVLHELVPATKEEATKGIYVSEFDGPDILAFPPVNKAHRAPICRVRGGSYVNDVAIDGKGNLIDPQGGSKYVVVFHGPQMCGEKLGSFPDRYGQPSDASSSDAATGRIAIGNIRDRGGKSAGSLSICTLRAGCTSNLTNSEMYATGGIAMSGNGDCWADAKRDASGGAALIYFQGCAGPGQIASGFQSTSYGGIDVDNEGNLVIIDELALVVYIYKGCNPACTVVGGPFPLKAESFFGKLNSSNSDYAAVDQTDGVVDVYSYSTKAIKYEYSFANGLSMSLAPEGIAQNPRSMQ
jgi:hypothetical protein